MADNNSTNDPKTSKNTNENFDDLEDAFFASGDAVSFWDTADVSQLSDGDDPDGKGREPKAEQAQTESAAPEPNRPVDEPSADLGADGAPEAPERTQTTESEADIYNPSALHPTPDLIADEETEIWSDTPEVDGVREPVSRLDPADEVAVPEFAEAPNAPNAESPVVQDEFGVLRYTLPKSAEGRWSEAANALVAAASESTGSPKASLLVEAAQIELTRVGNWDRAAELFDEAVDAGADPHKLSKGYADVIASQGRFTELRDILVQRASTMDGAAAVEALQDAAIVERNHLKDDRAAVALLERANAIHPDWFSLRLLRELHYRSQDWSSLVEVLAEMSTLSSGPRAARCKVEEGRIREVELRDDDGASQAYDEALRHDPTYMDAFLARIRVAKAVGDQDALVALYQRHAESVQGHNRQFWLEAAARVAGAAGHDAAGALYRSAIAGNNGSGSSLHREAAAYFERNNNADGVHEAQTAEAKHQNGVARASTLLLIGERNAGDPNRAVAHLTEAFNADPTCIPAVELAVGQLIEAGRGEAAVDLLEQAVAVDANRAVANALHFRMGEVFEHTLGKPDKAAECYGSARSADGGHSLAFDAEVRCLCAAGKHKAAVSMLQEAANGASNPEDAARLWLESAVVLERNLGAPLEAIEAYKQATEASSLQPAALAAWTALSRASGDPDAIVDSLLAASTTLPTTASRVEAGYTAARMMVDVLGDSARAEAVLTQCMEADPHNPTVVSLLRLVAIRLARWPVAHDLAASEAAMSTGAHREWLLLQSGYAALHGASSDAHVRASEILEGNPKHPGALALLEREALQRDDNQRLLSVTRRIRNSTDDSSERTTLTVRLASLAAELNEPQTASRAITRVLEASVGPRPYGAMAKLSVGLEFWPLAEAALHADGDLAGLARLLESTSDDHKRVSSAWRAVTKASPESTEGHNGLERSLTRMANRDGLAAAHAALATNEPDPTVSTMHALLAGHLFENDGARDQAVKFYRMAHDRAGHRGKAFDSLVRLYCELERSDSINGMFNDLADADPMGRADALLDAGAHAEASAIFRDHVRATGDSKSASDVLPMLVRYEQTAVQAEKWSVVLECLARRSDLVRSETERSWIQAKQRWLLSERMADSDEAWEFYRQLHEDHPDDSEVLENLARIAGARGESTLAIQFLDGLSNIASTAEEAARYKRRVAEVHLANDAPEAAREAFLRALDHNPNDIESLSGLKTIAIAAEDWQGLVGALTRESQLVEGGQKEECARQIAVLWEERLGDRPVAIESWRRVLELSPGDQAALKRLVSLAEAEGDWAGFIDDGKALVHYLEGAERSDLLSKMGRASLQHLRREEEAIRFLDEASSGDMPSLQAAEDLEQIHAARGSWDRVVDCILRRARAETGASAVALFLRAAQTRVDQLRDRNGAATIYDSVLAIDKDNIQALEFKGDFLFKNNDLEAAVRVFEAIDALGIERDLDDFDEQMEQSLYCFRFGEALRRLSRTQEAIVRYEQALSLNGSHLPTLEAVGPLYVAEQRFDDASKVFRQVLQLTGGQGDPERLARVYAALGTVEHAQGNSEKAVRRFNKALELQPNDIEALQGYACVLYERADWNNLLTTYNNIIYHAKERDAFVKAYLMKGFVLDSHMSLADKAGQHYEKSLSFDAANPYALLRLGELALRKDEWDRAASFAGRALAIGENVTQELKALLHAVAAVAAKETGRVDELETAFAGIKTAGTDFGLGALKFAPSGDGLHDYLRGRLQAEP